MVRCFRLSAAPGYRRILNCRELVGGAAEDPREIGWWPVSGESVPGWRGATTENTGRI
jgi:hypothetical protein